MVVLSVISILLSALSFRMFTGLFRRRTYCAAAKGTGLSANRPEHGMNSMSSNWGTCGAQPVASNSGARPTDRNRPSRQRVRRGVLVHQPGGRRAEHPTPRRRSAPLGRKSVRDAAIRSCRLARRRLFIAHYVWIRLVAMRVDACCPTRW